MKLHEALTFEHPVINDLKKVLHFTQGMINVLERMGERKEVPLLREELTRINNMEIEHPFDIENRRWSAVRRLLRGEAISYHISNMVHLFHRYYPSSVLEKHRNMLRNGLFEDVDVNELIIHIVENSHRFHPLRDEILYNTKELIRVLYESLSYMRERG